MTYNNKRDAVVLSTVSLGSAGGYAKLVAKDNATTAGLFAHSVKEIDASAVNVAASIVGNSLDNVIYGGTGSQSLTGGDGKDTFYYKGGANVITDYVVGTDKVALTDTTFKPSGTDISTDTGGLVLTFSEGNTLTFSDRATVALSAGETGINVEVGKKSYYYTKDSVADWTDSKANGITLAAGYTATGNAFSPDNPFATIDASAVTLNASLNITGTNANNYIVAANAGGSLNGFSGDNTLVGGNGADIFVYGGTGKAVIDNYGKAGEDKLSADVTAFTGAKVSGNKITFNIDSSKSVTFNPFEGNSGDAVAVTAVSLDSGAILTKDGYTKDNAMNLFSGAKGKVAAVDYNVRDINASAVKSNVVTLAGGANGGTFTFAANNKKADVFEYGGGSAVLANYEAGKDKINLGNDSLNSFTVDANGVVLDLGTGKSVSIGGAAGKEVLLHDDAVNKTNQYSKIVFKATGVVQDKESRPTAVTVSGGTGYTADSTVKKIAVDGEFSSAIAITGANVNTAIDLSNASFASSVTDGVFTVTGGSKNDKVTLSSAKELYTYNDGKDVLNGFGADDSVSGVDMSQVTKVTKSGTGTKQTLTLKFKNDSLTIKGATDTLKVVEGTETKEYQFGKKNTIYVGGVASLTSGYSGTYTASSTDTTIDGSASTKNLTIKGRSGADSIVAGSGNKTMLKGQGGDDTLVGGTGVDTFYYKKGETGAITIQNFGNNQDKIKISGSKAIAENGISTSGDLAFTMTNGATITLEDINVGNTLIKANNTYYWFDGDGFEDVSGDIHNSGWVTSTNKISAAAARGKSDFAIVDLGYSTNLVKAGLAYKADINFSSVTATTTPASGGSDDTNTGGTPA